MLNIAIIFGHGSWKTVIANNPQSGRKSAPQAVEKAKLILGFFDSLKHRLFFKVGAFLRFHLSSPIHKLICLCDDFLVYHYSITYEKSSGIYFIKKPPIKTSKALGRCVDHGLDYNETAAVNRIRIFNNDVSLKRYDMQQKLYDIFSPVSAYFVRASVHHLRSRYHIIRSKRNGYDAKSRFLSKPAFYMVGVSGFEPEASWSRTAPRCVADATPKARNAHNAHSKSMFFP